MRRLAPFAVVFLVGCRLEMMPPPAVPPPKANPIGSWGKWRLHANPLGYQQTKDSTS